LKIRNIENFMSKQLKLVIDEEFFSVTENILKGKIVSEEIFHFNCEDNKLITVHIKATSLLKLKDVFMFEF